MASEPSISTNDDPSSGVGRLKDRSPNYPVFDLEKAIERAGTLHTKYRTQEAPVQLVHTCWGLKSPGKGLLSGLGNQYIAALKAYGLVNVRGIGPSRKISISPEGDRILRNAPNRQSLIKEAALKPPIHKEIWDRFCNDGQIPDDDLLRHYLVWDRADAKFNDKTVGGFIERFRSTLKFAKLDAGDIIRDEIAGDESESPSANSEGELEEPPPQEWRSAKYKKRIMPLDSKEDVFSLEEGPVVLQWPSRISKASAQDLEDWLKLIVRKAKRAADAPELETEAGEDAET